MQKLFIALFLLLFTSSFAFYFWDQTPAEPQLVLELYDIHIPHEKEFRVELLGTRKIDSIVLEFDSIVGIDGQNTLHLDGTHKSLTEKKKRSLVVAQEWGLRIDSKDSVFSFPFKYDISRQLFIPGINEAQISSPSNIISIKNTLEYYLKGKQGGSAKKFEVLIVKSMKLFSKSGHGLDPGKTACKVKAHISDATNKMKIVLPGIDSLDYKLISFNCLRDISISQIKHESKPSFRLEYEGDEYCEADAVFSIPKPIPTNVLDPDKCSLSFVEIDWATPFPKVKFSGMAGGSDTTSISIGGNEYYRGTHNEEIIDLSRLGRKNDLDYKIVVVDKNSRKICEYNGVLGQLGALDYGKIALNYKPIIKTTCAGEKGKFDLFATCNNNPVTLRISISKDDGSTFYWWLNNGKLSLDLDPGKYTINEWTSPFEIIGDTTPCKYFTFPEKEDSVSLFPTFQIDSHKSLGDTLLQDTSFVDPAKFSYYKILFDTKGLKQRGWQIIDSNGVDIDPTNTVDINLGALPLRIRNKNRYSKIEGEIKYTILGYYK